MQGHPHRCFLLLRKDDPVFGLGLAQHRFFIGTDPGQSFGRICHRCQLTGDRTFRFIIAVKIDHAPAVDLRHLQAPLKDHVFQHIQDDRAPKLQQRTDFEAQFLHRRKRVSLCQIRPHGVFHRRLHPIRAVLRHAESARGLICLRKAQSRKFFQQPERVILCQCDRRVSDQIIDLDDVVIGKSQTAKKQHFFRRHLTDLRDAVRLSRRRSVCRSRSRRCEACCRCMLCRLRRSLVLKNGGGTAAADLILV